MVASARSVLQDPEARARLTAMVQAIVSDPAASFELAAKETDEHLQRLLFSCLEVRKALSGFVPSEFELELVEMREGLERRLLLCVLSSDEVDVVEEFVKRFFRRVRLSQIGSARLLNSLGLPDPGSNENPLLGFEQLPGDGRAEFAEAVFMLAQVWSQAWPPHAASVFRFCGRLVRYVSKKREQGVPWSALSPYYKHLMLKVDGGARRFACRESRTSLRVAPVPEWVDGGQHEYVRNLSEGTVKHQIFLAREEILAEVAAAGVARDIVAARSGDALVAKAVERDAKAAKRALERNQRKRAAKAAGKAAKLAANQSPGQGSSSASQLLLTYQGPEVAPTPAKPGARVTFAEPGKGGKAPLTQAQKSQAEIQARIDKEHPAVNGRKACPFFFGPARSCKFDAADCPSGHHGA